MRIIIGILLIAVVSSAFVIMPNNNPWELKKDKNGIKVYVRESDDEESKLKDSKAIMTVKTDVNTVIGILEDVEAYTDWLPKCKQSFEISKNGDAITYYTEYSAPMVSNRELVAELKCSTDGSGGGKCIVTNKPDAYKEVDGKVRMPRFYGEWIFTSKGDGQLEIINWFSMDPGGKLPDWLVNTSAVDSPYDTFKGLKERLGVD